MSDLARTEPPTPRRLREARRKGQVPRSRDLTAAITIWTALGALALAVAPGAAALAGAAAQTFSRAGGADASILARVGMRYADLALDLAAPVFLAAAVGALLIGVVQVGGLFSLEAVAPRLERLDPGRGLRRVLGGRGWIEAAKSLAKFLAITAAAILAAAATYRDVVAASGSDAHALALAAGRLVLRVTLAAAVVLLGIGFLDLAYQRWRHRRDLRMTREEVKRELKEEEGDPAVKAERMRLHRQMLAHRMVMDVPRATCVIVNPAHVAVALRYDPEDEDAAPIVLAKGEGELARRIVEAARAAGVPVLRNAPVARSLLTCELGDAIPERLYEAVAEVLRIVLEESESAVESRELG